MYLSYLRVWSVDVKVASLKLRLILFRDISQCVLLYEQFEERLFTYTLL